MNCDAFQAALHDYFYQRLAPEQAQAINRHALECAPCGELIKTCREISCKELIEFLNDYLDGELPPERRAVFERHLAICQDCTAYLDSYEKTMQLSVMALRGGVPAVPEQVPEGLLRAILAARKT